MTTAVSEATELEAAARELSALEAERRALPGQLAAAAREADGARLLALRQRRGELEGEIFAARSRLLRLEIEAAEQRRLALRRSLKEQEEELLAAAQVAREAWDFAKKKVEEHGQIALRMRLISNDIEIARVKASELRQQLAALIREASGEGGEQVVSYGERTGRPLTSPGR
jgi:hypothetical protein